MNSVIFSQTMSYRAKYVKMTVFFHQNILPYKRFQDIMIIVQKDIWEGEFYEQIS